MIKLSDHLYIPPMGRVLAERREAEAAEKAKRKAEAASKMLMRQYAAAKRTRLHSDWTTYPTGANYEIRQSNPTLRARSREAARDYEHIVNYRRLMRTNVIGPKGIQLQVQARRPDGSLNVELNKRVEEVWWEWGHADTCTLSGKLNWRQVQGLALMQKHIDGEFLVQLIEGADNEFGFAVKVWDVNWLDETYNDTLPNGNRVIMSVEVNASDRPVAVWMTTPSSEINFTTRRERRRTRVPAEQIIHGFEILDDETQARGVTDLAAVLRPARATHSYKEGVITSARFTANSFGVLEEAMPDGEEYTGVEGPDGIKQTPEVDISPGSFTKLPQGVTFKQFDPKQPPQSHAQFKKALDMDTAAGTGIPYFLLMGDWEAVNFSSSRGGLGEFRARCKELQDFMATTLCRRVYHAFIRNAVLNGKLRVTAQEFREIQNPKWQPRGFDYVDPTKDVATDVEKLRNRLATPSQILAERGEDYQTFLEQWKADKELAEQFGMDIDILYSEPKQLAPAPEATPDDEDGDEPAKPKRQLLNGLDHSETVN